MRMIVWLLAIFLTYGEAACYKKVYDFYCHKEGCTASFNAENMKLCHSEFLFEFRGHSYQVFIDNKFRWQLSHPELDCDFPVSLSWKINDLSRTYRFSAALKSVKGVRSPHYCDGKPHLVWGRVTLYASNLGRSEHSLPTARPTKRPTNLPTPVPTRPPTMTPTALPTPVPSSSPTYLPTGSPTPVPTQIPTTDPTITPTYSPTLAPTESPTKLPTPLPTVRPTTAPSSLIPSEAPSMVPTESPTAVPTASPTTSPTWSPTPAPTAWPTMVPSKSPTFLPSNSPTGGPTTLPTLKPTLRSTTQATVLPTIVPTQSPSTDSLGLCLNIIEWTEAAQENCIARHDGALHKGWKRAKLCPIQLFNRFNKRVDVYESSLNRSMADHIFESCSTKCVYDIENTGVAYRWRTGNCWELVKDDDCTIDSKGFTWTFDHITDMVCHVIPSDNPIKAPPTSKPAPPKIIITTDYPTEAPTLKPTSVPTLNPTPVSTLVPTVSEVTKKPIEASCMPRNCIPQQEWSEDLMDAYCSVDATGVTYKHHCHIGRAAKPCGWYEMLADNLKKSLAMRLYSDCSSTCVYDYYTNAHSAWKWSAVDLCWELQAWGPCHWDFKRRKMHSEWESARKRMSLMCPRSG